MSSYLWGQKAFTQALKHLHHVGSPSTFVYVLELYVTRLIENIKYRMFFENIEFSNVLHHLHRTVIKIYN